MLIPILSLAGALRRSLTLGPDFLFPDKPGSALCLLGFTRTYACTNAVVCTHVLNIHMYPCTSTQRHIHVHTRPYMQAHEQTLTLTLTGTGVCTHTSTYNHKHMCTDTTYKHMCMHKYTQAHTCAHTPTHDHIYMHTDTTYSHVHNPTHVHT